MLTILPVIKNNRHGFMMSALTAVLATSIILSTFLSPAGSAPAGNTDLEDLSGKAAALLRLEFQANGAQNGDSGVGANTLYVLETAGIDTGAWRHEGAALQDEVTALVIQDIKDPADVSAKLLAQDLLAANLVKRSDLADQILEILEARQKEAGFDENIYSNTSAYDLLGRGGSLDKLNGALARNYLLSVQYQAADGNFYGWGSYTWKGSVHPDIMATCQALRALSALDPRQADSEVQEVIVKGLSLLQKYQLSDGSFMAGMDDPVIDTAEVILTLKRLGLKPDAWVSASGKSAVDYLAAKALNPDGSFGGSKNLMDAVWVLDACASPYSQTATQNQDQAEIGDFTDISGYWAEQEIRSMAERGYATGVGNRLFAPDAFVTRAQFATFLVKALGINPQPAQSPVFSDVPLSHWACSMINAAYQNGLISGVGSGQFAPERNITREEMAAIVVRALKANGVEIAATQDQMKALADRYTDAGQVSDWAREAVAACISKELFSGRSADQISGRSYTSRAETVVVLERMLKYLGKL